MAKSKPMKVVFENAPNLERVARAYGRLLENDDLKIKSVTWREKRTGKVHTTYMERVGA